MNAGAKPRTVSHCMAIAGAAFLAIVLVTAVVAALPRSSLGRFLASPQTSREQISETHATVGASASDSVSLHASALVPSP